MFYCVVFIRYVDKLELCVVCGFCFYVFLVWNVNILLLMIYSKWNGY